MIKLFRVFTIASFFFRVLNGQEPEQGTDHAFAPLPALLLGMNGTEIGSSNEWETSRREEILELFRDHVYGRVPEAELKIDHKVVYLERMALGGLATQKEVEVRASNGSDTLSFNILIFLPAGTKQPVPLFLGLNFYGNHTIHPDPRISVTDSWVRNNDSFGITGHRASEATRGVRSGRWPVEMILERGYGLATIYYGDIDPDFHDGFRNGIHRLFPEAGPARDSSAWGAISAWAWGLSRAMDYLQTDPEVDPERVAVIGHSRLGKTSLWAGAQDERFALVISNNSGCGGAALSRRASGERLSDINKNFPHWFASRFHSYVNREAGLPVDQHMLLSLAAPRPLYVASAEGDEWADPYGEYLSLYYAGPVYRLYGEEVLESDRIPPTDQPRWTGKLGYHIRTGRHGLTRYDWEQYLDFADRHLGAGGPSVKNLSGDHFTNPVNAEWIREKIRKGHPRLILTPGLESQLKAGLKEADPFTEMGFHLLKAHAESLLDLPPLRYDKRGRRLLGVSREAINRLTALALVYRFDRDERYLGKLGEELEAVCSFTDWNPSHFLDVAEMAAGIALALDWAGEWLPGSTVTMAEEALVQKALLPGSSDDLNNWWTDAHHNWNLVCHGGLSLAALQVFEEEPELAAAVLRRAVEKIPLALAPYAPGGVYPEGPSYWFYATTYLTAAISAFESTLNTDFGFTHAPGIMESALFSRVLAGPSGDYYNYFDAGLGGFHSLAHFGLLSWFAVRSGGGLDLKAYRHLLERELVNPRQVRQTRFYSFHFLNLLSLDRCAVMAHELPEVWIGEGDEPLVVFRDADGETNGFFLAAKGGRASDNHGNMDAGSFVFELDGVRWSLDPGNQGYHELEQIMGDELWNSAQGSGRWKLLTKSNLGHSTLTVNGEQHLADARASMAGFDLRSAAPSATFDLGLLYGQSLRGARRTFERLDGNRLRIRDEIAFSPETRKLSWQLITCAEVSDADGLIVLVQDGEELFLEIDTEAPYELKVFSLSPPPLAYDKDIPGLKRVELHFSRNGFPADTGVITVELAPEAPVAGPDNDPMADMRLPSAGDAERPNFVWIISEDNSKHYMELFDPHGIATPHIEGMAEAGITFTRAFSNAPVCSVARSTLISSCYGPRTGAQFHRKSQKVPMPEGVRMFPAYLRDAGYYTTNNSKEDYNYFKDRDTWDESSRTAHWSNRSNGQPFFHKESHPVSHESRLHFSRELMERYRPVTDPEEVFLFPNHPDKELFRFTAAYYRDRILAVDTIVGRVLQKLEEDGLLESTFVFYFSDHGGVLPGSKGYIYETGLHIPLVVRIPEKFRHLVDLQPGSRSSGFVSFVDFGPTLLELAGVEPPAGIDGKAFLGTGVTAEEVEERDLAFGYADRFDEKYDLVRSVRMGRYKYIRSYQPFNPDGLHNFYRYRCLAYQEWREMFHAGELDEVESQFFLAREPEALYDLEADPFETANLAGDPEYRSILLGLRNLLTDWVKQMPDLSFFPESELRKRAFDDPQVFGNAHSDEIAALVDITDLELRPFEQARDDIEKAMLSADPWKAYWGLIVCSAFGREALPLAKTAIQLLENENLLVRTRAAEFLGLNQIVAAGGNLDPAGIMTDALYRTDDDMEATLILNSIVLLMDSPGGYQFDLDPERIDPQVMERDWVIRRLEYITGTK